MASRFLKIVTVYLLLGVPLALLGGCDDAMAFVALGAAATWLAVFVFVVSLLRAVRGGDSPGEADLFARQTRAGFPAHIEEWR